MMQTKKSTFSLHSKWIRKGLLDAVGNQQKIWEMGGMVYGF